MWKCFKIFIASLASPLKLIVTVCTRQRHRMALKKNRGHSEVTPNYLPKREHNYQISRHRLRLIGVGSGIGSPPAAITAPTRSTAARCGSSSRWLYLLVVTGLL